MSSPSSSIKYGPHPTDSRMVDWFAPPPSCRKDACVVEWYTTHGHNILPPTEARVQQKVERGGQDRKATEPPEAQALAPEQVRRHLGVGWQTGSTVRSIFSPAQVPIYMIYIYLDVDIACPDSGETTPCKVTPVILHGVVIPDCGDATPDRCLPITTVRDMLCQLFAVSKARRCRGERSSTPLHTTPYHSL